MSNVSSARSTRRSTPLLLIGGAVAAAVLVLGVNGTLSAWSSAIITNTTNTAQAAQAVALSESSAADGMCADTATSDDNTATCSTINKFGGTDTPLEPGGVQTATVTMTNTGTAPGNLTIAAGICTKTGGLVTTESLCDHLQVALECPAGNPIGSTANLTVWNTGGARPVGNLAAGASVECTFTVSLPEATPVTVAGQAVSQPLVWTLTAA